MYGTFGWAMDQVQKGKPVHRSKSEDILTKENVNDYDFSSEDYLANDWNIVVDKNEVWHLLKDVQPSIGGYYLVVTDTWKKPVIACWNGLEFLSVKTVRTFMYEMCESVEVKNPIAWAEIPTVPDYIKKML